MKNWQLLVLIVLIAAFSTPGASAYLWESQATIEQRYGQPTKTKGYPADREYTYAFEKFQVEVKFFNDSSQEETYSLVASKRQLDESEIRRILEANSAGRPWTKQDENNWVSEGPRGLAHAAYFPDWEPRLYLYTDESVKRMLDPTSWSRPPRTSKEETFDGVLTLRREEKVTNLVVRSGKLVIEIPWTADDSYPARANLISGKTYAVTLRDEDQIDIDSTAAFVSDREHKNFDDLLHDSKTYLLVRIQDGSEVVFDRSVCEIHHVKMAERMVDVSYGLWGASSHDEATCVRFFPHYRDFMLGGCVSSPDSPKKGLLYICPKCVEECERLKF